MRDRAVEIDPETDGLISPTIQAVDFETGGSRLAGAVRLSPVPLGGWVESSQQGPARAS